MAVTVQHWEVAYNRLSVRAGLIVSADSVFGSSLAAIAITATLMAYIAPASVLEHTLIQSFIGFQIFLEFNLRWETYGFRLI